MIFGIIAFAREKKDDVSPEADTTSMAVIFLFAMVTLTVTSPP